MCELAILIHEFSKIIPTVGAKAAERIIFIGGWDKDKKGTVNDAHADKN